MNKIRRILQIVFAFLVISIVGITKVYAEDDYLTVSANTSTSAGWWINPQISLIKYGQDGNYVFCLNSGVNVDLNVPLKPNYNLYTDKVELVNRIITKSIELGLNSNNNQFGISKSDFYGITQIAIWKAIHGTGTYGYTEVFQNWIASHNYSSYLDTIYSAVNQPISSPEVKLKGSDKLTLSENYMISESITVNASETLNNAELTISVEGGELYVNGAWTKNSAVVKNGDKIMVRTEKNSSKSNYSVTLNIRSNEFVNGYRSIFYDAKTNGFQNVGAFKPNYVSVSDKMILSGEYVETKPLKVSKTDATGQKELTGAKLTVKDNNGNEVESWISDENEIHNVTGLEIGAIYEIVEDYAPAGYKPIQNSIKFVLNNDGSVTTCDIKKDSNGKDKCEPMSTEDILKIKNEVTKLDVSKTDGTGQKELPGAKLTVKDNKGNVIDSWISTTSEHRIEGLEIGAIYEIIEDYAPEGYKPLQNSIKFVLNNDGSVTTCNIKKDSNGNDICEAMSTEDILKIKNDVTKGEVVISKKDFTNGEELPGAHLQILDENGNIVAEWVSTDEPYKISLPEGKYILVETLPATDYNPEMIILGNRTSRYEFEIIDGQMTKIDVYNEVIGVPITGVSATKLYILGGLVVAIGTGIIVITRKKEII